MGDLLAGKIRFIKRLPGKIIRRAGPSLDGARIAR